MIQPSPGSPYKRGTWWPRRACRLRALSYAPALSGGLWDAAADPGVSQLKKERVLYHNVAAKAKSSFYAENEQMLFCHAMESSWG